MDPRNSRIARNTALLYIRMFLSLGIGLFTSRILLDALGVENYGIYGVVGGIVALSSILTSSMTGAISRFITFEMGRGDRLSLHAVFNSSLVIQAILAVVVLVVALVGGMWFVANKMVIPPDRLFAAKYVLGLSIFSTAFKLLRVPFLSSVTANERFSFFSKIAIFESGSKLLIALLIMISPIDKLIFLSSAQFLTSCIVNLIYFVYARRNFEECQNIEFKCDKAVFRQMFNFAGWNFIGSGALILQTQGANVLLNLFGGLVVNAACGLSNQVLNAVTQFANNFIVALAPQITKLYASGERETMMRLVFRGSRYAFYILFVLILPLLFKTYYVLELWLKDVPDFTVIFVQFSLLNCLVHSLSMTLIQANLATGKMRDYQIVVGGATLLNLPICYVFLRLGFEPQVVFLVTLAISVVQLGLRLIMLRLNMGFPVRNFIFKVVFNVICIAILAFGVSFVLDKFFADEFFEFATFVFLSVVSTGAIIYFVGFEAIERQLVKDFVRNKILRL